MKLDLIAIRKLSPAGLWDLAELTTLISTMMSVINCGIRGADWAATVRRAERMAAQYRQQLRERALDNLNKRIKAWVMQCPDRIAEVRRIIGEATIKRWKKNRLLDYAFTKTFGDWKSAFPDGICGGVRGSISGGQKSREKKRGRTSAAKFMHKVRAYSWKPFALVKIDNAARLLYRNKASMPDSSSDIVAKHGAYFKLWGVDIADTEDEAKGTQPRRARTMKPVRFTPYELLPEAATGGPHDVVDVGKKSKSINGNTKTHKPPKPEHLLSGQLLLDSNKTKIEYKPP